MTAAKKSVLATPDDQSVLVLNTRHHHKKLNKARDPESHGKIQFGFKSQELPLH